MSLIVCKECGKKISDTAKRCPNCGYSMRKFKSFKVPKDKRKMFFILEGVIAIVVIVAIASTMNEDKNASACENFIATLQTYVDKKDYEGFEKVGWFNHENLGTKDCEEISCACPKAWDMFMDNKINYSKQLLSEGLVSSAYNELGTNYISKNDKIKEFFDNTEIFKLLSTKEKEDVTNIYHSFGEWNWKYTVGGTFKFNKRIVYYGSSELSLKFDDYSDEVLISGHLAPKGHTNWNKEKNISVNWYNYKIIDNKIYIKLKDESDESYDALFEIVSLTDTNLSLKLLINTTDVNAGAVYEFTYKQT